MNVVKPIALSFYLIVFTACFASDLPAQQVSPATNQSVPKSDDSQIGPAKKATKQIDTSSMKKFEGLFDFFWDEDEGKIWLKIRKFDQPFIYVSSLATGLGSNPVGLDRGQLGSTRMVRFHRVGPRVFLQQDNLKFRANTDNESERKAVRDSFASSIIWSGKLETSKDNNVLVDITSLLVRDAHGCVRTLSRSDQGTFKFDKDRSYVFLPRTRSFPDNSEFEAAITLTSSSPGPLARRTSASGNEITLRQHHSFVKLPGDGYTPRKFDPRSGCFSSSFADYAVPIDKPIVQRLINRHRLSKKDPTAKISPPVEPIVYYVDPGVPQPVRDALVEGASWWDQAFESAGYKGAFQVKILPEDADPMDVRYNVIQWVHRATRGWSYGQSVVDPRTGEIIKGHVLLGSLRVRQDYLLMEGLGNSLGKPMDYFAQACNSCAIEQSSSEEALSQIAAPENSLEVALARIRQLSAHEVGHTLGFAHNFAASTYADRASVMDYPAPRTKIIGGKIDLSDAYGVGIGDWDKFTVQYAYSDFGGLDESDELKKLVANSIANKMLYVTDADSRSAGAAHPASNLWDNGTEPISALAHEMKVRAIAISKFDSTMLAKGEPLSELEKIFVPIYLHHRYQVDATAKMLGGYQYTYAINGDGQVPIKAIAIEKQIAAFEELIKTVEPSALLIPKKITDILPPASVNSASDREKFSSQTSPIFDPWHAAEVAADLTIANMLQSQRASRLANIDDENWGLNEMISRLIRKKFIAVSDLKSKSEQRIQRIVQSVIVKRIIQLASSSQASHDAVSIATSNLQKLSQILAANGASIESAHKQLLKQKIDRILSDSATAPSSRFPEPPPGSPIGN